ncbi:nuclear transport factor 2 family protein [Undibacterium sp. Jales W-56]|uniref:nuclear transport factor 2 family protein n=1 Tax=Undibacterium sp. Jales W-56 TaxID=2897325 RepID=UPI0021D2D6B2|nr:nuclear transport factor 2 family protein [Undibacterium sp. Jales W-56]MCU6432973.1 nuclear transport factor 2 family protein [Undibacterium sp. Jales W-56]
MRRLFSLVALSCALLSTFAFADTPTRIRVSTPEDIQVITQVTQDFQAAIRTKNLKQLAGLMLHSKLMFESPASPEMIRSVREKFDPSFDGTGSSSYTNFAQFVAKDKGNLDERFSNVQITQDGHIAWVVFDYEFMKDNQVENYGVETWQMMKNADSQWKILSVVWSSHPVAPVNKPAASDSTTEKKIDSPALAGTSPAIDIM